MQRTWDLQYTQTRKKIRTKLHNWLTKKHRKNVNATSDYSHSSHDEEEVLEDLGYDADLLYEKNIPIL